MIYSNHYLYHHGIKGQRWGVRRFQNRDGSLTAAGRRRTGVQSSKKKESKSNNQKKNKPTTKSFGEVMYDENVRRMKTHAKVSAVTGISSVATAAVTAAGVSHLAKRGNTQAAATLYAYGTKTTQYLKAGSGMAAANAGYRYLASQFWK